MFVKYEKRLDKHIAERLKPIRTDKGLSQMKLADLANMHFTYYSQIERAVRKNVSVRILKQITDVLEVTLNDVVY
ncbi:MAG: helix-turn-helix transcriptional regulator [bacterium]|nr:helix-turn-helix transcriptional regulator [bacterium]